MARERVIIQVLFSSFLKRVFEHFISVSMGILPALYGCAPICSSPRDHRRAPDPLGLELQKVPSWALNTSLPEE